MLKDKMMKKKRDEVARNGSPSQSKNHSGKEQEAESRGKNNWTEKSVGTEKTNHDVNSKSKQNVKGLEIITLDSTNEELLEASMMLSKRIKDITRNKASISS